MAVSLKELKEKGYKSLNRIAEEINKRRIDSLRIPDDIEFISINRSRYFDPINAEKLKKYLLLSKGEKKKIFLLSGKSTSKTSSLKKEGYKSFVEVAKEIGSKLTSENLPEDLKNKKVLNLFSPEDQKELKRWFLLTTKEKRKETCLKKYGANSAFESEIIKEKIKETCLKKYGVDNPFKLETFQKKARATNRKNHNGFHNSQTKEWSDLCKYKRKKIYHYNDIFFDSSWELVYYYYLLKNNIPFIYHPCQITYISNGKEKIYEPDFKVYDRLVEIKGEHLLKDNKLYNPFSKEFLTEKNNCLAENNVLILTKEDIKPFFNYALRNGFNFEDFKYIKEV